MDSSTLPDRLATCPPPPPRELECSGPFRLLRTLAEGELATVYEADQLGADGFSKRVALRLIQPAAARHPEFLSAFLRETTRSANLMHGNIVQLYQLGETAGEYFVSMELIRGPTIRQLIDWHRERCRPIPPTLAAYITSRVCRALDYAHNFVDATGQRLDVVHGNVSPENVLATWDGHIKLADFGIALASRIPTLIGWGGGTTRATRREYMSPEQRLGTPLSIPLSPDARADVYSLGAILYELLALVHPIANSGSGESPEGGSPSLPRLPEFGRLLHGLDSTLEYILRRALENDASRRPTAAAFGNELDRWIATQQTHGSPDRLQSHLSQLFPQDFTSAVWTEHPAADADFTALERTVRHNSNGRAGLLERWFGR